MDAPADGDPDAFAIRLLLDIAQNQNIVLVHAGARLGVTLHPDHDMLFKIREITEIGLTEPRAPINWLMYLSGTAIREMKAAGRSPAAPRLTAVM